MARKRKLRGTKIGKKSKKLRGTRLSRARVREIAEGLTVSASEVVDGERLYLIREQARSEADAYAVERRLSDANLQALYNAIDAALDEGVY